MSISRRSFFGLMGAAVVATPALAELLTPKRTIFLPPKGGWVPGVQFTSVDLLISMDEFVRRYIKPAMQEVAIQIDRDAFEHMSWPVFQTQTLIIRRPQITEIWDNRHTADFRFATA